MALHTGLRYPERLGGIAALSCALPLADKLAGEAAPANRDVPVFMAHGAQDLVIPLSRGAEARDRLLAQGYRVDWHEYRMPHSVCAEEIADLSAWLRGILRAGRQASPLSQASYVVSALLSAGELLAVERGVEGAQGR